MKLRKYWYLGGLLAALVSGYVVQADAIEAEPTVLTAQDQSDRLGKFSVVLEEDQAKLILSPDNLVFRKVVAKVWTKKDKTDLKEWDLQLDEAGQYVAFLPPKESTNQQTYQVEVMAETEDDRLYSLKNYHFEWQQEQAEPSSSSTMSSEPASTSSSTSLPSSSMEPATTGDITTSEVTSEEATTAEATTTSQSSQQPAISAQKELAKGKLTIQNHNLQAGTFDVIVSNVSNSSGVKAVKLPVWTEVNGQDDLKWYRATKQADGTYKVTINKKDHKNGQGIYHVHLYYENSSGKLVGVASAKTQLSPSGKISIKNVDYGAGTFDVIIHSVVSPVAIKAVKVPVWTSDKGQDDIKWYTAKKQSDGSFKVSINKKDHKNGSGEYHVHLYYALKNGQTMGVTATKTSLTSTTKGTGTIKALNHDLKKGTFDLVVSNVTSPSSVKEVKIPVWTEDGGQDDIKWYTAKRQTDGTYKVTVQKSNHKNGTGFYQAHLYFVYTDGQMKVIGSTRTALSNRGTIKIANTDLKAGSFDVIISNIVSPKPIKAVKVPVWTEVDGQDDIKWYTADKQSDGSFKVTVKKSNHKNGDGIYQVHLYYQYTDGQMAGVTSTHTTLSSKKSTGVLSAENIDKNAGSFDLVVSKVESSLPIQAVQVPVWTEANGQDDIKWYTATKQKDGTYRVTVQNKNHKYESGKYHAHLYYKYSNGKVEGIATTKVDLPEVKASAKLQIANSNTVFGTFDVIVSDVVSPKGLDSVQVPVWSEVGGQDDIVWYQAKKQSNGTYKVTVEAKNHKYDKGVYHVHLYLKQGDGSSVGVGGTQTTVSISQTNPYANVAIKNVNNTYGIFDVVVSDVFAPEGVTKVKVPVWSDVNGQNDIRWYEANKQSDGTYHVTVRLANHKYEQGLYRAHVYIESNGKTYGVATTTTNVSYTKKSGLSFIDVSSHNGSLSIADYRALMIQGISGVVVKLSEGTWYTNPYAAEQIKNAKAVGLKVSVYHYSHFTSAATAQAEARYFIATAKKLGLSSSTLMVNDIEESKCRDNINANMKSWEAEMKRLGYNNLIHYTGASWIDANNLGYSGPIKTSQFGISNFWIAQYPYANGMPVETARSLAYYASAAAWQFTSKASLLIGRSYFDLNIDYTGRFTN